MKRTTFTKAERNRIYIKATHEIDRAIERGFGICFAAKQATPFQKRPFLDIQTLDAYPEIFLFNKRTDRFFWEWDEEGNAERKFALALIIAMTI